MKKFYLTALIGVFALTLLGCSSNEAPSENTTVPSVTVPTEKPTVEPTAPAPTVETSKPAIMVNYSVDVLDMFGEEIAKKSIKANSEASLAEGLNENLSLELDTEGKSILRVNDSIKDPSYPFVVYLNGEKLTKGINEITLKENDKVKLVQECTNTNLDELDKKVDLAIYTMLKNAKELFKAEKDFDGYFLGAITALRDKGYIKSIDFLNDTYLNSYNSLELSKVQMGQMTKYVLSQHAQGKDISNIKAYLEEATFTVTDNIYVMAPFYTAVMLTNAKLKNDNEFIAYFNNYVSTMGTQGPWSIIGIGDDGAMVSPVLNKLEGYDKEAYAKLQRPGFTLDGFMANKSWGANGASTGLQVMAFSILGMDIRANENLVEGKSLIDVLFEKYTSNGYSFKNKVTDKESDLRFATQQIMAGLVSYKLLRDTGNGEIF